MTKVILCVFLPSTEISGHLSSRQMKHSAKANSTPLHDSNNDHSSRINNNNSGISTIRVSQQTFF